MVWRNVFVTDNTAFFPSHIPINGDFPSNGLAYFLI